MGEESWDTCTISMFSFITQEEENQINESRVMGKEIPGGRQLNNEDERSACADESGGNQYN